MASHLIAPIPPYKALIFDCDGTLADTLPVHFQTWSASLQAVGADISKDWYYNCGTSAQEMLEILKASFGYKFNSELVIASRQRYYQSLINTVKEIQAVAGIVREHYGLIPIAVASGGERVVLEATLSNIKLRELYAATLNRA
ncbi:HAD family phosphatase [Nostoc sp. XA013]|nr:HAD family phosphatase [Nostoc sp. XA013]